MSLNGVEVSVVTVAVARLVRGKPALAAPDGASSDSRLFLIVVLALDLLVFGLARASWLFAGVWLIHHYWWPRLPPLGWLAAYAILVTARFVWPGASRMTPPPDRGGARIRIMATVIVEIGSSVAKGAALFLLVWLIRRYWWSGLPTVAFIPAVGIIASIRLLAGSYRKAKQEPASA